MLALVLISLENLRKSRFLAAINRGHVVGRLPKAGSVHKKANPGWVSRKKHSYFSLSHNINKTHPHFLRGLADFLPSYHYLSNKTFYCFIILKSYIHTYSGNSNRSIRCPYPTQSCCKSPRPFQAYINTVHKILSEIRLFHDIYWEYLSMLMIPLYSINFNKFMLNYMNIP